MENLRQLLISMSHDALCSSDKLLSTISILNAINSQKRDICDCFTTEVLDGIQAHVMIMVSKALDVSLDLPSRKHGTTSMSIRFAWGTIILLQQEAYN